MLVGDKIPSKKIKLSPLKICNNNIQKTNQLLFNIFQNNKYLSKKDSFIKLTGKFKNFGQNTSIDANKLAGKKILSRNFKLKENFINNNFFPNNKILKKNNSVNSIYLSSDLPIQKKYYSDIISSEENNKNIFDDIPYKQPKLDDMKTLDDKISQLAKDLNILKNKNNSNSKINSNLGIEELSKNFEKRGSYNRINSGKFITLEERLRNNESYPINNSKNIKSPIYLNNKLNIKASIIYSPFHQKERDEFLYNKIFNYPEGRKTPKILTKYIDNKYNLCYAENEDQFQKKVSQINQMNRIKGKSSEHNVGKTNVELQSFKLQKNILFIKKIFDYAYPNILIERIRKCSNVRKKNLREKKLKNNNRINYPERKILLKKYSDAMKLSNSMNIQKIENLDNF